MKITQLPEKIQKSLLDNNIMELFPIQEIGIDKLLEDRSLIMKAPTGSGKTLTYVIPTVIKGNYDEERRNTIVLVPNKELGAQVRDEYKKFTDDVIFLPNEGNIKRQIETIRKKKPTIYVGQSSRILKLLDEKIIKGNKVKYVVLDEVDKLFLGRSKREVKIISKKFYKDVPIYGFSATFDEESLSFLKELKEDAYFLEDKERMGNLKYLYMMVKYRRKMELTFKFLRTHNINKCIIFINSSKGVEGFKKRLMDQKRKVFFLHEDMEMEDRKNEIIKFRKEKFAILVTTDLMSRGLSVDDVSGVINYDLPKGAKSLAHRCGRASRGKNDGIVLFFVEEEEKGKFYNLRGKIDDKVEQIAYDNSGKEIYLKAKSSQKKIGRDF